MSPQSAPSRSSALASATTASWCAALASLRNLFIWVSLYSHALPRLAQILSGDVIEASVGVALGLSTMAAAGCGNMVSDVLGIGISNQIEASRAATASPRIARADASLRRTLDQRTCDALGFRSRLTAAQMQLRSTQRALRRALLRDRICA